VQLGSNYLRCGLSIETIKPDSVGACTVGTNVFLNLDRHLIMVTYKLLKCNWPNRKWSTISAVLLGSGALTDYAANHVAADVHCRPATAKIYWGMPWGMSHMYAEK
jgi:hypothetical protein